MEWTKIEDGKPGVDLMVMLGHVDSEGDWVWIASGCLNDDGTWGCDWADDNFNSSYYHTVTHWSDDFPENP